MRIIFDDLRGGSPRIPDWRFLVAHSSIELMEISDPPQLFGTEHIRRTVAGYSERSECMFASGVMPGILLKMMIFFRVFLCLLCSSKDIFDVIAFTALPVLQGKYYTTLFRVSDTSCFQGRIPARMNSRRPLTRSGSTSCSTLRGQRPFHERYAVLGWTIFNLKERFVRTDPVTDPLTHVIASQHELPVKDMTGRLMWCRGSVRSWLALAWTPPGAVAEHYTMEDLLWVPVRGASVWSTAAQFK